MFFKSLVIVVVVFLSACNVDSGKSISTSSNTASTAQASNGTIPSSTPTSSVQTNGNTATSSSVTTGTTAGTTSPTTGATSSTTVNDQPQGSGVPVAPNFGFGF